MATESEKKLRQLNRVELLELLVEQGEHLDRVQAELAETQARALHQERIARMAEDAVSRLAGILEAAQLVQEHYTQNPRELKAQMGIATERKDVTAAVEAPVEPSPMAAAIVSAIAQAEPPEEEVTPRDA